jgi:hypothetical protein
MEEFLTEDQFDERFGHVPGEDGSYYTDLFADNEIIQKAHKERRLWTVVEEDDVQTIIPGFRWVNRMAYLITERPYEPGEDVWCVIEFD